MLEPNIPEIVTSCPIEAQAVRVSHFGHRSPITTAVRVWPHPACWSRGLADDDRWFPVSISTPGAVLADPYAANMDDEPEFDGWDVDLRALLQTIPDEIRNAIRPFPKVYAWKILKLLATVPKALDLVRRNPVLAGLLAIDSRRVFSDKSFHCTTVRTEFSQALHKPRAALLALLGLPDAPWIVPVLAKLSPDVLVGPAEDDLFDLLRAVDKEVRHLRNHPTDEFIQELVEARLQNLEGIALGDSATKP